MQICDVACCVYLTDEVIVILVPDRLCHNLEMHRLPANLVGYKETQ